MKQISWVPVGERLPISGSDDDLYDGTWYEIDVAVLIDGKEDVAEFWACWEVYHPDDSYPEPCGDCPKFLMEFDKDGVTHWRHIEKRAAV
jgi:hypothetical protein